MWLLSHYPVTLYTAITCIQPFLPRGTKLLKVKIQTTELFAYAQHGASYKQVCNRLIPRPVLLARALHGMQYGSIPQAHLTATHFHRSSGGARARGQAEDAFYFAFTFTSTSLHSSSRCVSPSRSLC